MFGIIGKINEVVNNKIGDNDLCLKMYCLVEKIVDEVVGHKIAGLDEDARLTINEDIGWWFDSEIGSLKMWATYIVWLLMHQDMNFTMQ